MTKKRQRTEYYKKYRVKNLERLKTRYRSIRKSIFDHYGSICTCCGEDEYLFLTIDHINNDGNEHRKKIGGGTTFYYWLIKNNFPLEFQVLCWNCNVAKGLYGICPHKKVVSA